MDNLIFRASGVGALMVGNFGLTEIQEKKLIELSERESGIGRPLTDNMIAELAELRYKKENPQLSETAKSFVEEAVLQYKYKRRKEIKSKYLEKGILVEQDSVDLLLDVTGNFYEHRTERKTNEYFTGECDLISEDCIVDIKSSFDLFTFHKADFKDLYYWQGQVYMELYDRPKFWLAYCLVDMPKTMFAKLSNDLMYKYDDDHYNEKYVRELKQLTDNCFFSELSENPIPKFERVKVFESERNHEGMIELKKRVKAARKYADEFWNNHLEMSKRFVK